MHDAAWGKILLLTAVSTFLYLTLWLLVKVRALRHATRKWSCKANYSAQWYTAAVHRRGSAGSGAVPFDIILVRNSVSSRSGDYRSDAWLRRFSHDYRKQGRGQHQAGLA